MGDIVFPLLSSLILSISIHFGGAMAYLPILDILRSYFEIKEGEQEFLIKRKMKRRVRKFDEKRQFILPPLQDLLSLKVEDKQHLKLSRSRGGSGSLRLCVTFSCD